MPRLVPYAGFDPDDDNFDGIELAPLHRQDIERPRHTTLDIDRIQQLRGQGWTYDAIGRQLAFECGRRAPYQAQAVWWALRYAMPRVMS